MCVYECVYITYKLINLRKIKYYIIKTKYKNNYFSLKIKLNVI